MHLEFLGQNDLRGLSIQTWQFSILANLFPHISHAYGFSPVCVLRCRHNDGPLGNDILQNSHSKGLSCLCTFSCCLKSPFRLNLFWQVSHSNSLAFTCFLRWSSRFVLVRNDFVQPGAVHWKGRSPVCRPTKLTTLREANLWCNYKLRIPTQSSILTYR